MNSQYRLRQIPKMDDILAVLELSPELQWMESSFVKNEIRRELQSLRDAIKTQEEASFSPDLLTPEAIAVKVRENCAELKNMQLRKVINGTGVILHTNLGRAPLCESVKESLWDITSGYSNLEMDLSTGKRGSRYSHVKSLLLQLTGAEDILVVNNNAGAVLLVLSALSKNREVIISRGELVEIGGSFRIPEVMEQSGAVLVEVGATNKVYLKDYESAITPMTGALLKVHQSNFKIMGFTHEATLEELVQLANIHNIPLINDLGSGLFYDLTPYGFPYEPTVQEAVKTGCDIVTFSGDKLLGGGQTGIIAGKKELIQRISQHPLTRALRVDKMTLCALEATLKHYLTGEKARHQIPALKMMTASVEELESRVHTLLKEIQKFIEPTSEMSVEVITDTSQVGGGAYPTVELESRLIRISLQTGMVPKLERHLRNRRPAIVGRIQEDAILLDVRTLFDEDFNHICYALKEWLNRE